MRAFYITVVFATISLLIALILNSPAQLAFKNDTFEFEGAGSVAIFGLAFALLLVSIKWISRAIVRRDT